MLQRLKHRANNEEGFTLIELLVVILIIGILAAIALPAFLGQSAKAQDSSAKSNVRNAVSTMESCAADNGGNYTNCNLAALQAIENGLPWSSTAANGKVRISTAGDANGYGLEAQSENGNTFRIIKSSSSPRTQACTTVKAGGGCPAAANASGTW